MWETPLKTQFTNSQDPSIPPIEEPMKYLTVTCRIKPLLLNQDKSKIEIDKISHAITLNDPTKSISKTYSFDEIFDECVCQDRFTNSVCQPLVRFLKKGGQSGLIFSYGITNSGKTYTILGTKQQPGILLNLIKRLEEEFKDETIRIVGCQLYKDEFFSLKNKGQKLHPKQMRGTFSFEECHSDIINQNNMEELFCQYLMNRSCSSTGHNATSSRSHAIFKISTSKFRIGIVDLAGSQRSSKGQHDANVDIKETIFINSSLLTLKKCIKALEERSSMTQKICVPYRESKLTQALMEYFVPNSKINVIVNINQARHYLEQNLNVMDYTSKAKNITANATSDFSIMLKTTAKKKEALLTALKSHKSSKSNPKSHTLQSHSLAIKSKQAFSKTVTNSSENSKNIQNSQQTQQIYEAYQSLEAIEEQNERKPSEQISTTINSHSDDISSNCLIEEIQYEHFNPIKQENEHKIRYSVQFMGQDHKYIIDEETIENQELSTSLMMEIQTFERNSFIEKKNQQQTFEQFIEKPLSIEEFIQKQQMFRNYLAIDRQLEAEADARKLSALKKVNLFESTTKKIDPHQFLEQKVQKIQINTKNVSVGTQNAFIRSTEDLNQRLANIEFEKLRTTVKKRLLQVLDEEKKKILVDAHTSYSCKKQIQVQMNNGFRILNIDETEVEQEESNFTTPSKNVSKNKMIVELAGSQKMYSSDLNSNLKKSLLEKTFEKVTSGMKYMADKVGLGNHIFRTNNKQIRSLSEERIKNKNKKCDMKIWKEISERIDPLNKISYGISTNTEVDVFPSVKKVRFLSEKSIINSYGDNEFDIDAYPQLEEKKVQIQTWEVGIQTENIEVKFVLQQALEEVIHEEKKKKDNHHNLNHKKNKKNTKDESIAKNEKKEEEERPQFKEKMAFKNFSIKKDHGFSLKKRNEFVSAAKIAIAKNTRAAQRKRQGPNCH